MVIYVFDDLFKAPKDQLLVHACNCQGVWGSGVAKQFKSNFYEEWRLYRAMCTAYSEEESFLVGRALIVNQVGCLFTSKNYGEKVDPPQLILENTEKALQDLISKTTMKIAMPKINSGLFKVPWEQTLAILEKFPNTMFYVYIGAKVEETT